MQPLSYIGGLFAPLSGTRLPFHVRVHTGLAVRGDDVGVALERTEVSLMDSNHSRKKKTHLADGLVASYDRHGYTHVPSSTNS